MKLLRELVSSGTFSSINLQILLSVIITILSTSSVTAQERPSIFLNGTYTTARQNFCPLHSQVENGEVTRRNVLKNKYLHVGLFDYQLNSETGAIDTMAPGVGIRILDELAIRAGFNWRDSYGVVSAPSGNETWDSILHSSVDGYDLVGDWYLRTTKRLDDGVLFPEGWYDGSLIMVRKKSEAVDQFVFFAFLKPFDAYVWAVILVTIFMSGFVYYLIDYFESRRTGKKMEGSLSRNIFAASYYMAGHFEQQPTTASTRIMAFSLCFLFLILTSAYTANMASFLVTKNTGAIVINDINDAVRNDQSFCVMISSTSNTFLSTNYPTARLVHRRTIADTYESVAKGECDIVLTTIGTWETNRRSSKYNNNCELEWVGRVVEFNSAGYSIRDSERMCSSLLRDVIDLHIIEMKSDGTFDDIWLEHREKRTTVTCLDNEGKKKNTKESIKVTNLGGLFICHAVIMVLVVMFSIFRLYKASDHTNVKTTLNNIKSGSLNRRTSHLSARSLDDSIPSMNDDPKVFNMDIAAPKAIQDNSVQMMFLEDILMEVQELREEVKKFTEDDSECKEPEY